MKDRIEAPLSFTPIITLAAGVNSDEVDAIQHDIGVLNGSMSQPAFDVDGWWYYAPNLIVENSSKLLIGTGTSHSDSVTALVGASGNQLNPNEAAGASIVSTKADEIDANLDAPIFLYIKNTGTSDINGTVTDERLLLDLTGGTVSNTTVHAIVIDPGQSWMGCLNAAGCKVKSLSAISVQPLSAGSGSGNIRCKVAMMLDNWA